MGKPSTGTFKGWAGHVPPHPPHAHTHAPGGAGTGTGPTLFRGRWDTHTHPRTAVGSMLAMLRAKPASLSPTTRSSHLPVACSPGERATAGSMSSASSRPSTREAATVITRSRVAALAPTPPHRIVSHHTTPHHTTSHHTDCTHAHGTWKQKKEKSTAAPPLPQVEPSSTQWTRESQSAVTRRFTATFERPGP